jgi:hypothetical protein
MGSTTMSALTPEGRGGICAAFGLGLAGLILFLPRRRTTGLFGAILVCVSVLTALGLNGCSGGGSAGNPVKTAQGTYNFTVTATSGNVHTQSAYTLVVQ